MAKEGEKKGRMIDDVKEVGPWEKKKKKKKARDSCFGYVWSSESHNF